MSEAVAIFAAQLAEPLGQLLAASLIAFVGFGIRFLRARTSSTYLDSALLRLDDAVRTAVRDVHQRIRSQISEATEDGKLSPSEARGIKDAAVDAVKGYLGDKGLAELKRVLGPEELEQVIRGKIEEAVLDLKAEQASVGKRLSPKLMSTLLVLCALPLAGCGGLFSRATSMFADQYERWGPEFEKVVKIVCGVAESKARGVGYQDARDMFCMSRQQLEPYAAEAAGALQRAEAGAIGRMRSESE